MRRKRIVFIILLFSAAAASMANAMYCSGKVISKMEDYSDSEEYYEDLADSFWGKPGHDEDKEMLISNKSVSPKFCFGAAGWLYIPDTPIDYPVAQESGRAGYYLDHRLDGSYSSAGCLYIPAGDDVGADNVIIYGHNMRNGSMFAGLKRYREEGWARQHRTIYLLAGNEWRRYDVIAVLIQSADKRSFRWDDYICFMSDSECADYGMSAMEQSVVRMNSGVTILSGDERYLTLVTCDYTVTNGRLTVIAVLCD